MPYALSFAAEFFDDDSHDQAVASNEPWTLRAALERMQRHEPGTWASLADEWLGLQGPACEPCLCPTCQPGQWRGCHAPRQCDCYRCDPFAYDLECRPCRCVGCDLDRYPALRPEMLSVDMVLARARVVDLCGDLSSPVDVYLDRAGWYRVHVYDKPEFNGDD